MGSQAGKAGTIRFLAPELLVEENPRSTCASDVYAFGCLCLEVRNLFFLSHLPA